MLLLFENYIHILSQGYYQAKLILKFFLLLLLFNSIFNHLKENDFNFIYYTNTIFRAGSL